MDINLDEFQSDYYDEPRKQTVKSGEGVFQPTSSVPWKKRGKKAKFTKISSRYPLLKSLQDEITDYMEYANLTPEENRARLRVLDDLKELVHRVFPEADVHVFGSFATNLSLPTSDLDVVILQQGSSDTAHFDYMAGNKADKIDLMDQLAATMVPTGFSTYHAIQKITRAKVPVLKTVHFSTGVKLDISFNTTNGPAHTDMVRRYLLKYPVARSIITLMKHFLLQRGLNEPYTGGLGGYALTCMVVSFFTTYDSVFSPDPQLLDEFPDAVYFLDFLDFVAHKVDFWKVGISVKTGFFPRRGRVFDGQVNNNMLCIEDPQRPSSDIGSAAYAFDRIRSAVDNAYSLIVKPSMRSVVVPRQMERRGIRTGSILTRVLFADSRVEAMRVKCVSVDTLTAPPSCSIPASAAVSVQGSPSREETPVALVMHDGDTSDSNDSTQSESSTVGQSPSPTPAPEEVYELSSGTDDEGHWSPGVIDID
ncbi:Nucleotidyltransferase domain [Carpediemonas membranifera]|uniref:Nucleotidyltransferase domain n=1 Tax=Carpediemonas membranifera TaxID=201153 RepID=A0A8J6B336_9EUKA|nr:Nucleotidyltransferase domain [Carpediemonas membranifera]|eukprot:KAG9394683.1 Nucleotidyltransferase domain [Carpediemonas membranifera]